MQAPFTDRSDIKIFILYLMSAVGRPLDYVDINDIVVQNGLVSPFDFADCFPELINSGHVQGTERDGRTLYFLTELGIEAVDSLQSNILNMTRDAARKNAFMLLELKKKKADVRFGIEPTDDGKFKFWCNFYKDNKPVIELAMRVENRGEAEWLERSFDMRPDEMSRAILSVLKNKASDDIVPF